MLSIAIVNRDKRDLLEECLRSVELAAQRAGCESELIVIDNGSRDGSAAMVADRHRGARLVELGENEGFAPAVARATELAQGHWLVLVNNDALLDPECLALLWQAGESDPSVGAVTCQVRFADRPEVINTAGLELDKLAVCYDRLAGQPASDGGAPTEIFGASGCVAAYRLSMLRAIGGFDPAFFAYLEDADVAWRARMAGWRCLYEPRAVALHHGSATLGEGSALKYELVGRNRIRLIAKNATLGHLLRWGWAMALYDLAYITFVALSDRTLAPARGRLRGIREFRSARRAGLATRRPIELSGTAGWLGALRMRAAYRRGGSGPSPG
jgi:GT2 family glycosyltransferase